MASRARAQAQPNAQPIIIKRKKKGKHGPHHNAQWKVAYADFATAMMAFFMLLWLMSNSQKVSLQGLADYFAPSNATMSNSSGSGGILAGSALGPDGAKSSGSVQPETLSAMPRQRSAQAYGVQDTDRSREANSWPYPAPRQDDPKLVEAELELRTALIESPNLANLRDNIIIEQTPEGFRIQLVDTAERPMFRSGTAELYPFARAMLTDVARTIARQPNRIDIQGHSDARGVVGNDDSGWELSTARANVSRRVLLAGGVSGDRIAQVGGRASTDPLYPDAPDRPENRRITILLLREAPAAPANFGRNP